MNPWRDRVLAPVASKLAELEDEFARQLSSPIPIIAAINTHIAKQRGKRVRPALLLLTANMLGYQGRGDVTLAAVVEFIHTATLVHDDIIDNATTRRGARSVNAIWGNNLTVLLGDYLYLKSMELALTQGSLRALEILTEVTIAMIEGELIQNDNAGNLEISRDTYLDVISRKTAALFSGCGRLAAHLADARPTVSDAIAGFCHSLGMAFQLVDDLLDFVGDEQVLGKPVISDLREGRVTLPVIELVAQSGPTELALLERWIGGEQRPADEAKLLELLQRRGTLTTTSALAHTYAKEARSQLSVFPPGPGRRSLEQITDYIVGRSA